MLFVLLYRALLTPCTRVYVIMHWSINMYIEYVQCDILSKLEDIILNSWNPVMYCFTGVELTMTMSLQLYQVDYTIKLRC